MSFQRIILVVLDSLGVGELPDANRFNDEGANTLLHTDEKMKGLRIPALDKLGLMHLIGKGLAKETRSYFTRMKEVSLGKDTTTGHWEMMGLPLQVPMSHFPHGFPMDLMTEWSMRTGCGFLGNKPASGTVIIDELGAEHLRTKNPIVYTSADSVFQIAAHEEVFGLENLYRICDITRKFLDEETEYKIGRVIARPFEGTPGTFKRTGNRRDYSILPPARTVLNDLVDTGVKIVGVGKIPYIFGFQGISESLEAHNDMESVEATLQAMKNTTGPAVIFTNLNDLDMMYGHRRDYLGYGKQIEWIDQQIARIQKALGPKDLLVVTADHGNDPTYRGTDHTREFVPLLLDSPLFREASAESKRLPERESFSDLGKSLCENFGVKNSFQGASFLPELKEVHQ